MSTFEYNIPERDSMNGESTTLVYTSVLQSNAHSNVRYILN